MSVRYLKITCNLELTYNASNLVTVGYLDTDHALQLHWHSISDYVFIDDCVSVSPGNIVASQQ